MSILEIGCCGAYCKTCRAYRVACQGCKIGYNDGSRLIDKAKCKIKVCCVRKGHDACADCRDFDTCRIINGMYKKNGYKYGKYRQANVFIREHGYKAFLKIAGAWKNAYGKY
ncbi:MAG: DUF3795 domain-containing protein [bacterium]|nr:DUF3795 domain-containing protein [bacterium]